jgi:hypothetical protein
LLGLLCHTVATVRLALSQPSLPLTPNQGLAQAIGFM